MLALVGILLALLLWMPYPLLFWVLVSEVLILAWTHRTDLRHLPRVHPGLVQYFYRTKS